MRMLCCPCLSPRNFSSRLPGGHFKSGNSRAASIIPSLRFVTSDGGEPRVLPVRQIASVARFAKLLITSIIITTIVNNVKRYYRQALLSPSVIIVIKVTGEESAIPSVRRDIFLRQVTQAKLYPWTALTLLTALNLLNYIDRSVLFAVQPLVQSEFHLTNTQIGYLTSAFLGFYMIAAPFTGPLADRYSRKKIIVLGAIFWSALTLLTAVTHTYWELLVRHTLVGVGEATFVTIAPTFVADLFPESKRGRIFGIFYLAIPVGTAAGYLLGGKLGPHFGWRFPFYIAAFPGFLLALSMLFIPEPPRGQFDSLKETPDRATLRGLAHNPAFWTVTLGMAAGTFSLGRYPSVDADFSFTHARVHTRIGESDVWRNCRGRWHPRIIGRRLARRPSAATDEGFLLLCVRCQHGSGRAGYDCRPVSRRGPLMVPAIAVAAFLLLLNTSPLNTALVNSVGAHIRATAIAVNIFMFHLFGDVPSPTLMGYVADRRSLQAAFIPPVIAMAVSSAILFYGMRFAPPVRVDGDPGSLGGQPG